MIGHRLDPEAYRLRDFLTRVAQPFDWIEAETPDASGVLEARGLAEAVLPVVIDDEEAVDDATVERLVAAGLAPETANVAVDTLFGYVNGFTIEEQAAERGCDDVRFRAGIELLLDGIRLRLPPGGAGLHDVVDSTGAGGNGS